VSVIDTKPKRYVSAMGLGSLSGAAITSLNNGAAMAGTLRTTGEGVRRPAGLAHARPGRRRGDHRPHGPPNPAPNAVKPHFGAVMTSDPIPTGGRGETMTLA